jgi:hypothetical protein
LQWSCRIFLSTRIFIKRYICWTHYFTCFGW